MKRFLLRLLAISILPILGLIIFSNQYYRCNVTTADSGFDAGYGDYDSGGDYWGDDGGGYWDGSDSSSNGSADPVATLIAIGLSIVVTIIVKAYTSYSNKLRYTKEVLLNNFGLRPGDGDDSAEVKDAYQSYVNIQKAWMNRDLTPIKHLLTDEMYNMYQMQVETLVEDNQINVMTDFEFVCGKVSSVKNINNLQTIKIILCVNCRDYIKDANTRKLISGSKTATITYIYELTFVRDVKAKKATNCPACGAKVKNQMSANCPYCNNSLLLTSSDMTLANKVIKHQFKR